MYVCSPECFWKALDVATAAKYYSAFLVTGGGCWEGGVVPGNRRAANYEFWNGWVVPRVLSL